MPPGLRSTVSALAALAVVAAGLVVPGVAQAAPSPAVTLTITPTSVASGAPVELKASMPVRDDTGTVAQEIVQTIDPTKVKLTAATDIVAPQGWTLSYSFDSGSTWTGTAPTSATGTATSWDKVTAVKASGSLVTDGSDAGRQVASANVSGPVQSLAPAALQSTVGDGYQAFFDPARTRVFNVYHHTSRNLDCWVIQTGAKCAGFPFAFGLGTDTSQTLNRSTARVVGNKVWISGYGGLYCVDIAAVLATPQSTITNKALTANVATLTTSAAHSLAVGATVAVSGVGAPFDGTVVVTSTPTPTTFTYAKTNANVAAGSASGRVGGVPANCSTPKVDLRATGQYSVFAGAATSGESSETKLYAVDGKGSGTRISCIDTATMTSCGEMDTGWGPSATPSGQNSESIVKWGNQVYVSQVKLSSFSPYTIRVTCFVVTTGQLCSGWSSPYDFRTDNTRAGGDMTWLAGGQLFALPDASGQTRAVCWARPTTTASDPIHCWTTSSTPVNGRTTYGLPQFSDSWNTFDFAIATTQGSRVYVGDANYTTTTATKVYCYDAAANAGAGGKCNNRDLLSTKYNNYTVTPDPLIPDCLWLTRHNAPVISTVNILNDTDGCGSLAPIQVTFSGTTSVPRMGCSDDSAIAQWRSFTLNTPTTGYTSLRLTVQDSNGVVIPGWDDTVISATVPKDLSGLSVSLTGQRPNFIVRPVGISGSVTATAQIKAVGDSPELCLTPLTIPPCPNTTVIKSSQLADASTSVTASGSTTPGGSVVGDTEPLTILKPSESQCGGTLTGRAGTLTLGTTGDAVPGLIATLLDDTGNVLKDDSGVDITATTNASGNYSFGFLRPAIYKVRFPDSGLTSSSVAAVISSVTVATGGSGTNSASGQCPGSWTFDSVTSTCARTVTATTNDVGAPVGVSLSYLIVGGGGGGAAYNAAGSRGGAGGQVMSGSASVTGTVGVTIGAGGAAGAAGGNSALSGLTGGTVTSTGGAGGGGSNPAGTGTSSSLSGTATSYGVGGPNWSGAPYASAGQTGTANRGNGGGAGWRSYEGAGCYYPGSGHVFVNPGGPCGSGNTGTYENGGWSTIQPAGAGGSGVVVLRYPIQLRSNSATVPVGGAAVVNALYIAEAVARPNTSTGAQGATQTISPLADDSTSSGATWPATGTPVKLCPVGTSPACTQTSVTVTGQGTYTANANGTVSFVPLAGFTGTATSLNYTATDSAGRTASSTLTPTVAARPTATADTSSGAILTTQTINVRSNDTAAPATSLLTNSIELCTSTETDTACDGQNRKAFPVSGKGVYIVDDTTGTVRFTPCGSSIGSLVVNGVTYSTSCSGTPFTGTDTSVKYIVKDGLGQLGQAAITVTVNTPTAVTAVPDTSSGARGVAQSVNPLSNDDTGTAGVTSTASSVRMCGSGQSVPNCTVTFRDFNGQGRYVVNTTTGVITFTPCGGTAGTPWSHCTTTAFTGAAPSITYQATDNLNRTFSSTYTPTVVGTPTASPDTSTGAFNTAQTITPLANDTAGAGGSLVSSSVRLCAVSPVKSPPNCDDTTVVVAGQGTYSVNPSTGVVTFTPLATFTGTATAMRYQVTDSVGQVANSTITPSVSSPPAGTANPDTTRATQGQAQIVDPLANDSVPSGVTLVGSSVRLCDGACDDTTVIVAGVGTYTVHPVTGQITFTPVSSYSGTPPALSYQVTDSLGRTLTSTYTPTVVAAPTAMPDASTGAYGLAQTIDLLGDDSADPSTSLVPSSVRLCGPPSGVCDDTTVDDTTGRYVVNLNGTVGFTPCTGNASPFASCTGAFSGTTSPLTYQVSDGLNQTARSTITVTVTPPAAPTATDDTVTLKPSGTVSFTKILGTGGLATPAEGNLASAYLCQVDDTTTSGTNETQTPPNCTATSVRTADGTWTINPTTGIASYTNTSGSAGTQTPVTYQVNDTNGRSGSALLTPVITPPPTLNPDASRGERNQTQTIAPLGNDAAGSSSSPLDPTTIKLCLTGTADGSCTATTLSVPSQGTYIANANGTVTFIPCEATGSSGAACSGPFTGGATPIKYAATDSTGQVASSTITVTVLPPPAPTGVNDARSAAFGNPITFTPLTNDSAGTAPAPLVGAPITSGSVTSTTTTTWSSIAIDSSSLKLCGPGPGQSVPGCSATSVSTPDGTYTVSGSTVVFTGCADAGSPVQSPACAGPFLGSATQPVTYQFANSFMIDDSTVQTMPQSSMDDTTAAAGGWTLSGSNWTKTTTSSAPGIAQISSASITPTITRVPLDAKNDASTALVNRTVTISPLSNDDSGSFPLNAASIRLCGAGQTLAAGNCNATSVTVPGQGTFTLNGPAGRVEFTPLSNWTGTATVPYVVTDSQGYADGATITVTVNAPIAVNDDSYGLPGATQVIMPLLNDSAAAGTVTSLTASSLRLCGTGETVPDCSKTTLTTAKGTYSVNTTTGAVTFTPASNFLDGNDAVTYVVRDNLGEAASAVIRPYVVGPPSPVAADDTAYAPEGQTVTFTPWSNDTAMGTKTVGSVTYTGGALTQASVRLCGAGDLAGSCDDTTVTTADGTYSVNTGTGAVTFTPAEGFTGTAAYPVTYEIANPYTVNAGSGSGTQIASARLIPVITTPPVATAADDTGAAAYGQSVSFSPWVNDSPMGNRTVGSVTYTDAGFTPTSVRLCGTGDSVPNCDDTTVVTDDGTYAVNLATGQVTFTPIPTFSGPATPVRYQVTDAYSISNGGTPAGSGTRIVSALLRPTIGPLTPPNADSDAGTGLVDDTVVLNPIINDDTGTLPLSLASLRLCDDSETAPACNSMTVAKIGQGTFVLDPATGLVTFTPAPGWHGVVSIPYVIADTQGTKAPSSLEVTITQPVMPTANDDSMTTAIDTPVTLPAATDDDSGTYALNYSSVLLCGADDTAPACTQTSLTLTAGTFTVDPTTGQVTFTPAPGWYGNATVRYSVADTRGNRDSALLSVTIPAPAPSGGGGGGGGGSSGGGGSGGGGSGGGSSTPPATSNDGGVVRPGSPAVIDPLANDTPGGGSFDATTVRLCPAGTTPPACAGTQVTMPQGTWKVDPVSGQVTFTPDPEFHGKVEVPYQVTTKDGTVVDAVITVWIVDPPKAADDASSGGVDQKQTLDPWVNDAPDAAAPWDRGSLRLCGEGQAVPGCTAMSVTTPDGTYAIDPATGKVIFTPAPGFTGEATPVQYQVTDAAGQVASAWLRPRVRGAGEPTEFGTLVVTKHVRVGEELRAGAVKLVATCKAGKRTMQRYLTLPLGTSSRTWEIEVPSGMTCTVHERAAGARDAIGIEPTYDGRPWAGRVIPRMAPGDRARLGTVDPISSLRFSATGGCAVTARSLVAVRVGTCVVAWRVPDGSVAHTARWTYSSPLVDVRSSTGSISRRVPVGAGDRVEVTVRNTYRARAHVVTRTVHVLDRCSPAPKVLPRGSDAPVCAPRSPIGADAWRNGRYTGLVRHSIIIT